ncbi:tRNA endonuclease ANKZF1-like [Saccoglossus kowalevskii]|uniref:Ankyrin repeat and zinc finger domain-containing protein 1-like n=1 Tax=Saccoglossus kowalevskii TaxID=10224 RepID=A0ABM0MQ18_SACKO|nr:PREDICTED: ankyrin repeat and zinc finger domain-containing protein 1-like [Saccoglossus kowalevskii]
MSNITVDSVVISASDDMDSTVQAMQRLDVQQSSLPNSYFSFLLSESKAKTFFRGLSLASCQPNVTSADFETELSEMSENEVGNANNEIKEHKVSDKMLCSTCNIQFHSRSEQKEHYKLDWHRFNLKQKAIGLEAISEEEFEKVAAGGISSISGSDSSDETDDDLSPTSKPHAAHTWLPSRAKSSLVGSGTSESETDDDAKPRRAGRRYPKVYFKNEDGQIISVYRCLLHGKKDIPVSHYEFVYRANNLVHQQQWCILMVAGGHFAGALFNGDSVVMHKTFHRYTVRAKRGTSQGARDSQSGAFARSAGASLRRYNEAALSQDIHDLLDSWSEHLAKCDHIFLRAPSFNKSIFFGGKKAPFDKKDCRIVTIPFSTRRPTFAELKRVHSLLSVVECYGQEEDVADMLPWSPKPKVKPYRLSKQKDGSSQKKVMMPPDVTDDTKVSSSEPVQKTGKEKVDDEDVTDAKEIDDDSQKIAKSSDADVLIDEEESLALDIVQQVESTLHLKEFDVPRRKRQKKKKKPINQQQDPDETDKEKTRRGSKVMELRNELYTACKIGDESMLLSLLENMHASSIATASQEKHVGELDKATQNIDDVSYTSFTVENVSQSDTEIIGGKSSTNETTNSESVMSKLEILNDTYADDGRTLLHISAKAGQRAIIRLLLEAGADPAIKDKNNRSSYASCIDKATRNEFRKFMADYPNKYNYSVAQIPAPLTSEMEEEKSVKLAEKRKERKKAKREKLKEQKAEEQRREEEEKERQWFVSLSDREKRALAAERRLAHQREASTGSRRCWMCGESLTDKVPFEYMDFKFCTMRCLKQHKQPRS